MRSVLQVLADILFVLVVGFLTGAFFTHALKGSL
jgi:hypothetical protein